MTERTNGSYTLGRETSGVIARVGGSVGRVAAGVRRAFAAEVARRGGPRLIARTWWGTTRAADADRYLAYLQRTGLREYRNTAGNRGALALRRVEDGRADFLLISFWESERDVRAFAGAEPNRARFFPADERFLVDADEQVVHYELVFSDLPVAAAASDA